MSKRYLKTESFERTVSTADIKKIRLENISGNIQIKQGTDSSQLIVEAIKEIKVRKKDLDKPLDEIEIKIDTEDNVIRIKTEYSTPERKTIFRINMGNMANVDYVITVPPGIDLNIENINGNVTSDKLDNDLTLDLVNGKTTITNYSGILECKIVNGSFTGEIINTNGVSINSVNGSITLNLNNYINAEISAETVNGKISDSNLMIKEIEKKKRKFKGYLGSGSPDTQIKASTVNGKIQFIGKDEI
ncbi:MAG TPA: hypothetical protein PKA90_06695 [Ignavibacteria bacterium]|nr:hypothetical protein [Ignavibacteria bacterium]HMR40104.1 hypothetical protein [Ignavibacteria bacterium]